MGEEGGGRGKEGGLGRREGGGGRGKERVEAEEVGQG